MKFLEMFVNVTEKAGLKSSLAKACSATGSMCNALVGRAMLYNYSMGNHIDSSAIWE